MQNRERLIQQIRFEEAQSDRIYNGSSCVSSDLDAGWKAEIHATRCMAYRAVLMELPWEDKAQNRLSAMADKMNTNGAARTVKSSNSLASHHSIRHLAPKVSMSDIDKEIKYIKGVVGRCNNGNDD